MQRLVRLFQAVDQTTSTLAKISALVSYFRDAPAEDAVWTLYYFLGRKQKRLIKRGTIQSAVQEISGLPPWLFDECYTAVGDLGETIALLTDTLEKVLPDKDDDIALHTWIETHLPGLSRPSE